MQVLRRPVEPREPLAVHAAQEVEQEVGAAAARAEVDVGKEKSAQMPRFGIGGHSNASTNVVR